MQSDRPIISVYFTSTSMTINQFFTALFFLPLGLLGQSEPSQVIVALPTANVEITEAYLRTMLEYQFSRFITGDAVGGLGSYASLTTGSDQLKLGTTYAVSDRKLITAEISAGAIEGVAGLFTDGRINRGVSGQLTYHQLIRLSKESEIRVSTAVVEELNAKKAKIEQDYAAASLKVTHEEALKEAEAELAQQQAKLKNTQDNRANAYVRAVLENKIKVLKGNVEIMKDPAYFSIHAANLHERKDDALAAVDASVAGQKISWLNLFWVSLGIGVESQRFALFQPLDTTAGAVTTKEYTDRGLQAALSHYRYHRGGPGDLFVSLGLSYRKNTNLGSLKSITLRQVDPVAGDSTAVAIEDRKVFVGDYREDQDQLRVFLEYYNFFNFNRQGNLALHLGPELLVRDGHKPNVNMTIGLLLPFIKKDSSRSALNVETFIKLQNVFGPTARTSALRGKTILGVSVSFPITFLN